MSIIEKISSRIGESGERAKIAPTVYAVSADSFGQIPQRRSEDLAAARPHRVYALVSQMEKRANRRV